MTCNPQPEQQQGNAPPLEWAWYEEQVERLSEIFPLSIAEQIAIARF